MRSYYYNLMQLSLFEIAWFAHTHGQLPDDYFASWAVNMSALSSRPSFRDMWQSDQTKILHDGFRKYVESLIKDSSDKTVQGSRHG